MSTLFGVNIPYLGGEYGHDLAENGRFPTWPCRFDPMGAYGPIVEARRLGFRAARMWLCENAEGVRVDSAGHVIGVSERLLESIRVIQEAAHLHGLYLYWNLLDGNSWAREGDTITRSILADRDQAARFAERVVAPISKVLDDELTLGVDVVNEPESCTADCIDDPSIEPVEWASIGNAIRLASSAARAERELLVTSGTMHVFLPKLWETDPGLNAVDIHVYHESGGLPSREDLAKYVGDDALLDPSLPILGGEVGIPKDTGAQEPTALCNYLYNAERLGYAAVFLWQLEGDLIQKDEPTPTDGKPRSQSWRRSRSWLGDQVSHVIQQLEAAASTPPI